MDVVVQEDVGVATTVVGSQVVGQHAQLDAAQVRTNHHLAGAGREQATEAEVAGHLGQVGVAVGAAVGGRPHGAVVVDPAVLDQPEPAVLALAEHTQVLGQLQHPEELESQLCAVLLEGDLIHLDLAALGCLLGLPAVKALEDVGDVVPAGGVEV